MTAAPLKNKICGATKKGIFFEIKDVAAAVEWLKENLLKQYPYIMEEPIFEMIDEAFEDVVKGGGKK